MISRRVLLSSPFKFLIGLSMTDEDSLQDSRRGVPGNIQIPQEDATVATAASVASQGSATIFQQRARCTLLEIEQDEVVVRKGDCGLPGSKVYVANQIAATQSLSNKFLGSFHLQSFAARVIYLARGLSATSASVLASLTGVIDRHITNVESAKMSSFLGELRNALGN